jgi:AcrR family transcriptional regulator
MRAVNTRGRIVDAAYKLFWRHGFLRTTVDDVAAAAGLTKRTLYAHFPSKDALLAEVMVEQGMLTEAVFGRTVAAVGKRPEELVATVFRDLAEWSARPRWTGTGFSRLAIELADQPGHPARAIARRHKAALELRYADAFRAAGVADAGALARKVWVLLEGAIVLRLIHGDPAYIDVAAELALSAVREHENRQK